MLFQKIFKDGKRNSFVGDLKADPSWLWWVQQMLQGIVGDFEQFTNRSVTEDWHGLSNKLALACWEPECSFLLINFGATIVEKISDSWLGVFLLILSFLRVSRLACF